MKHVNVIRSVLIISLVLLTPVNVSVNLVLLVNIAIVVYRIITDFLLKDVHVHKFSFSSLFLLLKKISFFQLVTAINTVHWMFNVILQQVNVLVKKISWDNVVISAKRINIVMVSNVTVNQCETLVFNIC